MDAEREREVITGILQHLGGNGFITMIGAYDIGYGTDDQQQPYLSFKFKAQAQKGINYAKVTLNFLDLYDLDLFRIARTNPHYEAHWVSHNALLHADALASTFRDKTGLETRMPKIIFQQE